MNFEIGMMSQYLSEVSEDDRRASFSNPTELKQQHFLTSVIPTTNDQHFIHIQ
jgi:hypothetical protein